MVPCACAPYVHQAPQVRGVFYTVDLGYNEGEIDNCVELAFDDSYLTMLQSGFPTLSCQNSTGNTSTGGSQNCTVVFGTTRDANKQDSYLAVCGCEGNSLEAAGQCGTGDLVAATILMRLGMAAAIFARCMALCESPHPLPSRCRQRYSHSRA